MSARGHDAAARPAVTPGKTWWLSWRLARYRPALYGASVLAWGAFHAIPLGLGPVLQRILDELSQGRPAGLGVYELLVVLLAIELARLADLALAVVVWIRDWLRIQSLLRLNMFRAQMRSGGPEAGTLPASAGEAVSRFRDDTRDAVKFVDTWLDVIGTGTFTTIAVTVLVTIDPVVTVAVVLPVVAMLVATQALTGRVRAYRRAEREATAAVTGFLGGLFGAVLAVKSAAATAAVLRHLDRLGERRRRAALRDQLTTDVLDSFNASTVDLAIGLVLLLAVPAMARGDFTVGDLALFASYSAFLVDLPHFGGRLRTRRQQSGVAFDRMRRLLPPGPPDPLVTHRRLRPADPKAPVDGAEPGPHEPLRELTVSGLTALHPGSGRGVRDASLTLHRGTLTVVAGAVGSGKTTLVRALLGLLPAQAGTVTWNGREVTDRAAFMVPPRCAYVPQVPRLFSESLGDNLRLGADAEHLDAALHAAVLEEDVAAMPEGLATMVGARGVRLSGGQVQRAAVARAAARSPDLLVLDDVSSALDVATEQTLWDRLLTAGGATYLVVSNRPATIARADQVLWMDGGRGRAGPPAA